MFAQVSVIKCYYAFSVFVVYFFVVEVYNNAVFCEHVVVVVLKAVVFKLPFDCVGY